MKCKCIDNIPFFAKHHNFEIIDIRENPNNNHNDYEKKLILKVTSDNLTSKDFLDCFISYCFNYKSVLYESNDITIQYNKEYSKEWLVTIIGTRKTSNTNKDFIVPAELIRKLWMYVYKSEGEYVDEWVHARMHHEIEYWFGIDWFKEE